MLYEENGVAITTHSMIKTMRRCPRQALYKYADRLKPRSQGRGITMGNWMHGLLETHYKGGDWRKRHEQFCAEYAQLFDEEKDKLGDLPRDCKALMESYLWHYKADHWRILAVEFTVQTRWPDGSIYRGKVDLLIEDDYGLWIVDHKNHKRLPNYSFRELDTQSPLYVWAARRGDPEAGIEPLPVRGFIWNYLRTAPPSRPKWLEKSQRLSKVMGDTTYVVWYKEMKRLGLDPRAEEHSVIRDRLLRDRFTPGEIGTSTFFQRHVLERDDAMLHRLAGEAFRTHRRLHSYPFHQRDTVERTPDFKGCEYACSYLRLCRTELHGGITANIKRQDFRTADPLEYHQDDKKLGY